MWSFLRAQIALKKFPVCLSLIASTLFSIKLIPMHDFERLVRWLLWTLPERRAPQ